MTYLALTEILSYKVQRGQTSPRRLTHTHTTHSTSCKSCSVRQTHGKDVAMRWVTGSVLYLWIFLMLHGSENRDTTVRRKKTRVSQSSLSASQSKQQWNFGRLDFFKTKASIEEKTGRGGVGGVRVGWSQTGCNEESDAWGEMCSPWRASTMPRTLGGNYPSI